MALDFPLAPVVGQQYPFTPVPGQPVFIWDGEKWTAAPPTAAEVIGAVRYDAPQTLTAPQLVQARSNIAAAPYDAMAYSGMQINGGMEVSQENGTASITVTSGGIYLVDGVSAYNAVSGAVISEAQVTDAPPGFNNSIKFTVTTGKGSLAAADEIGISVPIEGYRVARLAWGTANAQAITISFWCKTHRTGMYSGAIGNVNYDRTYAFTWTQNVADAWEYKTAIIPGDTTGVWAKNNTVGIGIIFMIAGGTGAVTAPNIWTAIGKDGATGTTNGVAATSDTFQITGVTVLPGTQAPTAAQSPNIMRPYDQELVTCMRYWEKNPTNTSQLRFYSNVTTGFVYYQTVLFKTVKRAAPTMTVTNAVGNGFPQAAGDVAADTCGFYEGRTANATGSGGHFDSNWIADARL